MVQEVERLDAELEAGAFVQHRDGLHDAEIERRSGGNPLAIAGCADRTGRYGEGTGAVDVGGEKRIEGTAAAPLKDGREGDAGGQFVEAARGEAMLLVLTRVGPILTEIGGVEWLFVVVGSVVFSASEVVAEEVGEVV